jgi:hypothetical protein
MAKRKDKDESANDQNNENNSEDNFGLPDLEYKPLDTETTGEPETESIPEQKETVRESYSYTPQQEEAKSNAPIIIAVVIGLVLIVGAFLIYQYVYKPKAEKEKRELAEKKRVEEQKRKDEEAARLARENEEAERKRLEAEAANAKPAVGTFETLTSRTGRYYVVIASAVDGDLIMDYAKKLSAKGTSSKIIPPFGKWKFYRLTIGGDFDSYAAAQTNADSSKPEFGQGAWVIKY